MEREMNKERWREERRREKERDKEGAHRAGLAVALCKAPSAFVQVRRQQPT
jgi:hypothetical protein